MRLSVLLLLCVSMLLGGCGPDAPQKAKVKGQVTLDGKPMPDGEIHFATMGKPPAILPIKNGNFEGEATLGKKQVQIYAYRKAKAPPTATGDVTSTTENYIPPRYNIQSKFEADVTSEGPNEFSYAVTSQ